MTQSKTLQDVVSGTDDLVGHLRNLPTDTWEFVGVPGEFTNWRDEQLAGHETAVILHQGHMRHPLSEFYVRGEGAFSLLNYLGANSFNKFVPGKAKQYIVCNEEGFLIGDCILLYVRENTFCLVGAMVIMEWVKFQAQKLNWADVEFGSNDVITTDSGETHIQEYYQLQLQGPKAKAIIEKLNGHFPDVPFFNLGEITIAGHKVNVLHHSMLGEPGLEMWFPLELREEIVGAIVAAGEEYGLKQVGTRVYPSQTLESGWIGMPLPAIYSGEKYADYRAFLPDDGFEAFFSIGGSFIGEKIDDYYYTPFDMNYGNFVKFDHDFIGRAALEAMKAQPHNHKVTLEWHPEDVAKIHSSYAGAGEDALPYKFFDMPWAPYGMVQADEVRKDGKIVGRSADVGYSHFARATLSLAVISPDVKIGDEVTVTWGEENGGTAKNSVERHRQIQVRAIVRTAPFTKVARETYHSGWRTN